MVTLLTRADQYFDTGFPLVVIKNSQHGKTSLHRHEFYEIVYIDPGVSLHSHEGQIQILTAGDLFLVLPGEVHSYISTHNTGLYNCLFTAEAFAGLETDISALAELGWILHRDHWKKGYGTELAGALIRFGFAELKLHRIIASCIADNYGSYRVMENSHMRREAHFIKNRFQRGEWQDEFIYALLQEEWEMMK